MQSAREKPWKNSSRFLDKNAVELGSGLFLILLHTVYETNPSKCNDTSELCLHGPMPKRLQSQSENALYDQNVLMVYPIGFLYWFNDRAYDQSICSI